MSLPVTSRFITAQQSDANLPISQVQLVLGNYMSSAAYASTVASSGDFSASYPAAGAIDGDRTEINVGPAFGADNDIGLSSWKSSGVPDNGDVVTLTVTFNQSRTINRIKLYHLSGHGLKTYKLSYLKSGVFVDFAATSDIVIAGQTSITTAGTLDTIDFSDITTTQIKLTITHTQVASDNASVVEMEAYRKVDITSRVKDISIQRSRDYKLGNPLATMVSLQCTNDDRFFSINHVPTASETAAGFVNVELQPGIGILIAMGFNYYGIPELTSLFVGSVDRFSISPGTRDAIIEGRDGMKGLINKIDSTKLKSANDISNNIKYVLNRANISNYEMILDTTGIAVPYFFTDKQDQLSTIRNLVQASGDAIFFFNESGMATFKFFAASTALQHIYTTESDWESGTLTAIDTTRTPGDISYLYSNFQTWNNATTGWTVANGVLTTDANGLVLSSLNYQIPNIPIFLSRARAFIYRAMTTTVGEWVAVVQSDVNSIQDQTPREFEIAFMFDAIFTDDFLAANPSHGYALQIDFTTVQQDNHGFLSLVRYDGQSYIPTTLISSSIQLSSAPHTFRIRRSLFGVFTVFIDDVEIFSVTDDTYTIGNYFAYAIGGGQGTHRPIHFYSGGPGIPTTNDGIGTWISPVLDTGATVNSYGILTPTFILNGATISYLTSSSADDITYDPYVAVSGNGQINSTVRRYLKIKAVLTISSVGDSPSISDITVVWTIGAGTSKYPAPPSAFVFSFDSTLLEVQQELSDNLGGDTSILNDVIVQAQPLVLTGADADTIWQGTVGVPPTNISASTPLNVTNGQTITVAPVVPGGMDVSRMTGANPAAAVVTFAGGAAGSWSFFSIHPTIPVLKIVITNSGTITDLRIIGKKFSNITYFQAQQVSNLASIVKYGDRLLSISNQWISSTAFALSIATTLVANFKDPTSYIPSCKVRPAFSAQLGDRVTISDVNLDLSADYIIVNLSHTFAVSMPDTGDVSTQMTLLKVPAGS